MGFQNTPKNYASTGYELTGFYQLEYLLYSDHKRKPHFVFIYQKIWYQNLKPVENCNQLDRFYKQHIKGFAMLLHFLQPPTLQHLLERS